jgi:hypothetical protein
MKILAGFVAMSVVLGGAAWAGSDGASFPAGDWAGTAQWRGPGGSSGTYEVSKSFAGRTLSARYAWDGERSGEERHTVTFTLDPAQPIFDVLDEQGHVVGTGHCYDDACAYEASFGPVRVLESFRWTEREMSVLGSKSGPGFSVVWRETLSAR